MSMDGISIFVGFTHGPNGDLGSKTPAASTMVIMKKMLMALAVAVPSVV
jgi:hypothetical protein